MKKQFISLILILTMVVAMGSFVFAEEQKTLEQKEQTITAPVGIGSEVFQPGDVPAQNERMESMIPPVNALVMCMLEQNITYHDEDDTFFWNGLYYMLSFYGQMDERAEFTDETMTLPSEAVEDYAAALFTNFNGLTPIPVEMQDSIRYNPETDTYETQRGDMGLAQIRMDDVQNQADGTLLVTGAMVYTVDNTELAQFQAVMTENNGMFGYAINNLTIIAA